MTPAAIQGIYETGIISTFDIDKPERLNILFRRYGDQGVGYFRMLDSMGFKLPTAQETFEHDEEDWKHETFHELTGIAAPGPGNNASITLSPQDVNAATGNAYYPRLFETVMFPNEVTGQIIAIDDTTVPTAPVLTIRPNEVTDDIGAVAAGQELIIISDAWAEGSDQPDGAVAGVIHYDNDVQIIKEKMTVTGTEMTNQKWITKMSDPNNKNIYAYHIKGQEDMEYRMQLKIDGAMLFQKRTTNTGMTDPTVNRNILTTEGCVPYIRRTGNILPYTPSTFSVQKFNEVGKIMDKNHTKPNICWLNGINLQYEIEDTLVDYLKDTNVNFAMESLTNEVYGGNRGLAVSVNFSAIKKGNYNMMLKKMPIFSHAKLYGASGYDHAGMGIVMPVGKKKDKKTMEDLPTFGMRYKKLGPYSRFMETFEISGAGTGKFVQERDEANFNQRCHIGAHHMAGNQMLLMDPS